MKTTKECGCRDGERCDSIDEYGTLCADMQAIADYWRVRWNNASHAERMTVAEYNDAMVDAGRGHLVAS